VLLVDDRDRGLMFESVSEDDGATFWYEFAEHWHMVHVPAFAILSDGFDVAERATIQRHHWWSVKELRASTDRITPTGLADLLDRLLCDGVPGTPWTLTR
jgi:hypothetical protein